MQLAVAAEAVAVVGAVATVAAAAAAPSVPHPQLSLQQQRVTVRMLNHAEEDRAFGSYLILSSPCTPVIAFICNC